MPKSVEMANPATVGVQNEGVNPGAEGVQTEAPSGDSSGAPKPATGGAMREGVAAEEASKMDTGNLEAVAHADKPVVIHSDLMKLVPGPPTTKEQIQREKEVLASDAELEQAAMQGVTVSLKGLFKKNKDKRSVAEKELDEQRDENEGEAEAPKVA